nr:immunoglobulin heavy chain junction region [Mus musculus]
CARQYYGSNYAVDYW